MAEIFIEATRSWWMIIAPFRQNIVRKIVATSKNRRNASVSPRKSTEIAPETSKKHQKNMKKTVKIHEIQAFQAVSRLDIGVRRGAMCFERFETPCSLLPGS